MKKRPDGRYQIKVNIGKDWTGKTQYKYLYDEDKNRLLQRAAKLKADADKGMNVLNYNNTFSEIVKEFLAQEQIRQTDHIYSVKKANLTVFNEQIGNLPIKDIKPYNIEAVLSILAKKNPHTGKPSTAKTLKEYNSVCSQVFKFAIKNRIIDYNPCVYVIIPNTKAPTKKRRALTDEERLAIHNCECDGKLPAMLMIYAGLRRGEVAALLWKDIDFKDNVIYIDKAYNYSNRELKSTKTENGIRAVPMPTILVDYLKTVKKKGIYVVSDNGKMTTAARWEKLLCDLQTEMEKILNPDGKLSTVKVGNKYYTLISFENFGWHDLRHTYATLLACSGVSPSDAKELLGHKDITTTINIYTHNNLDSKKTEIVKLSNFIANVGCQGGCQESQTP